MSRLIFLAVLIFFSQVSFSQDYPGYRDSPISLAQYKYGDTYIKVTYGKPFKRGRKVFGGFVPFGRVWRTGANEATEITFTNDVYFDSRFVKSGTYSLFTIPTEKEWIVILNKKLGQFGSFEYDRKQDLLRVSASSFQASEKEDFTIEFRQEDTDNKVFLVLWWDTTLVKVPIKILR